MDWLKRVSGGRPSVERAIHELAGQHGYGVLMELVQRCWLQNSAEVKTDGFAFAYGPSLNHTVPCGCVTNCCEWCKGSQWLTPKVKAIKDSGQFN